MMVSKHDGNALVYCEGAFCTPNGKTAHGLVRFTNRYRVVGVIDSRYTGRDAVEELDAKANGIPIYGSIKKAVEESKRKGIRPTHLVVGLAPDGGRLGGSARGDIEEALELGLNVVLNVIVWIHL